MHAPLEPEIVHRLESMKGRLGPEAAREIESLLDAADRARIAGAASIARLHETLLFLRAYPASPAILSKTEEMLRAFARHIDDPGAYAGGSRWKPWKPVEAGSRDSLGVCRK